MINITHSDGAQNKAAVFTAPESAITLICLPAMGVKAAFYKRFAQSLCATGFNVITCDWRGNGSSSLRPGRGVDWRYEQLIQDIDDLLKMAGMQFPDTRKIIVGHNLGGQIGTLYAARYKPKVAGLILITTYLVHYRSWQGYAAWHIAWAACRFAIISRLLGYFPGQQLGFAGREAKTVMLNWCQHALTGTYRLTGTGYDYDHALTQLNIPVLAISVADDELASKTAVIAFLNKLHPDTPSKHWHITANDAGVEHLDHFNWAKKPASFVDLIKN